MLIKLLKYDLLADYKKYCAVYIAMLAASLMMFMSDSPFTDPDSSIVSQGVFAMMTASVFMMLSAAVAVMVLIFSISRFYKNLVRDEGYLMHTLPVPTWQLLTSKLITVYIWTIATVIMELICLSIAFRKFIVFEILFDLMDILNDYGMNTYLFYLILAPFFLMSCIYFALSLGNLFNKSKLGMSVAMYFAIRFAENILTTMVSVFVSASSAYSSVSSVSSTINLFLNIILSVGYFIAAIQIFSKKLNLE